RTKIALYSKNPNIDCVGTCVGVGGARINAVINELNGEKIDIIRWSEDIFEFIAASLNPAEVNSVEINELTKSSKVIVPDNKLSLAIGKGGLNVRLAAKLTGWSIDVKSESQSKLDEQKASEMNDLSLDKVDAMDIFEDLETLD
ncbi:MAG: KH domain-containing protein, partial [Clostridia bacterium]|nr:KH domain-containing protein [Clostridia bacterium]